MTIRKGRPADIDRIMRCYDIARRFMRSNGNPHQWVNGYPSRELVILDITEGRNYVGVDDTGRIVMTFAFILGDDPTYAVIVDGSWPDSLPYGTIHRLASDGSHRHILERCVDFCAKKADRLRLDTHADNLPMQRAAERLGFRRCGTIFCDDGSPRIAYHRYKPIDTLSE